MQTKEILEAALKLPEPERIRLVARLLETLPTDELGLSLDRPDLLEELERRFTDLQGTVPLADLWSQE